MKEKEAQAVIEALLFTASKPLRASRLKEKLGLEESEVAAALKALEERYQRAECGLRLKRVAGGYLLETKPSFADHIKSFHQQEREEYPLTRASLETLAIIAYRQPITRTEREEIRGVRAEKALNTLGKRGLIEEQGRRDSPGKPIIYGTSQEFLLYFGLEDLSQLPEPEELILGEEE